MELILYAGNSMVLRLEGLSDHEDEPVADAVVTATLTDAGGAEVWSGALAADETPGDYEATLSDALAVEAGQWLDGEVVATAGAAVLRTSLRVGVRVRK